MGVMINNVVVDELAVVFLVHMADFNANFLQPGGNKLKLWL